MGRILGVLLLVCALSAWAADVSGKWTGSVVVPEREEGISLQLKQSGQDVTGTAGPSAEQQLPIEKGRLEGDQLTFQVTVPGETTRVFRASLKLVGEGKLEGTIEGQTRDGEKVTATVKLARAADVTGKWSGTVTFTTPAGEESGAYAEMTQSGQEVTGKAGPPESVVAIEKGRMEGDKLTFQVTLPEGRAFQVSLKLVADGRLEGTLEGPTPSGEKMAGTIRMTREK